MTTPTIQSNSYLAGYGVIFDRKTNSPVRVVVSEAQIASRSIFQVILLGEDSVTILGKMELQRPQKLPPHLSHIKSYGTPWIQRHRIDSYQNERYRGVGTLLTQISSEVSHLEGLGGKVGINAISSYTAHYKIGFRSLSEEGNIFIREKIKKEAQEILPFDKSEGGPIIGMYLPLESIAAIAEQIRIRPILMATKERLEANLPSENSFYKELLGLCLQKQALDKQCLE